MSRRLAVAGVWLVLGACAPDRGTIGAMLLRRPTGRLWIAETPERLAASQEGLKPGDELVTIDGRDVRGMTEAEIHGALAGDVGSVVKLTLLRGERVIRVTLRRTAAARPARREAAQGADDP